MIAALPLETRVERGDECPPVQTVTVIIRCAYRLYKVVVGLQADGQIQRELLAQTDVERGAVARGERSGLCRLSVALAPIAERQAQGGRALEVDVRVERIAVSVCVARQVEPVAGLYGCGPPALGGHVAVVEHIPFVPLKLGFQGKGLVRVAVTLVLQIVDGESGQMLRDQGGGLFTHGDVLSAL